MKDIIILLNGGFVPIRVNNQDLPRYIKEIEDVIRTANIEYGRYLKYDGANPIMILSKSILGYYVRDVIVTSQEKLVNMLEKSINDGTDEWKKE